MTSGNPNNLTIYPDYCHALSPTINKWCPLRAIDIHALRSVGMFDDGKEIYHHGNHPIKWTRITGVIVAIDDIKAKRIYTVDDSSGMTIECTCPIPASQLPTPIVLGGNGPSKSEPTLPIDKSEQPSTTNPLVPWDDVDVGLVVKIKGKPGKFWDTKQIEIVKVEIIRSTEQEVRCWDEVFTFREEVLGVPWVVAKDEEEKLRRRAIKERQLSRKRKESEESRKKRKDAERRERHEEVKRQKKEKEKGKQKQKQRDGDVEGLGPGNKVNYPSLALRRQIAEQAKGKYDALGI